MEVLVSPRAWKREEAQSTSQPVSESDPLEFPHVNFVSEILEFISPLVPQKKVALPPKMVQFHFLIHYNTRFGEELRVCGSIEELGNWNVLNAPKMTWSKGNRWTLIIDLPPKFEFKYVLVEGDGNPGSKVVWEDCWDRVIEEHVESTSDFQWVTLEDAWGTHAASIKSRNVNDPLSSPKKSKKNPAPTQVPFERDESDDLFLHNIVTSSDSSTTEEFLISGIKLLKEATEKDRTREYAQAVRFYEASHHHFLQAISSQRSEKKKNLLNFQLTKVIDRFMDRALKISEYLLKHKTVVRDRRIREFLSKSLIQPRCQWSDVIGQEYAKQILHEAVVLPCKVPQLFTGLRRASKGVLLFGPAGVGKTFLAHGLAQEAGCTLFAFAGDDLSHWPGEIEKLLKTTFDAAVRLAPTVILIDDVDQLDRMVRKYLFIRMNAVSHSGVKVVVTTSKPWELDSFTYQCLEKWVYVPLLDFNGRLKFFKSLMKAAPHSFKEQNFIEFALLTDGYPARDIYNIVSEVMMKPISDVKTASCFKKVLVSEQDGEFYYVPCALGDPEAMSMSWQAVERHKLCVGNIKPEDVLQMIRSHKPSVSQKDLQQHRDFLNSQDFSAVPKPVHKSNSSSQLLRPSQHQQRTQLTVAKVILARHQRAFGKREMLKPPERAAKSPRSPQPRAVFVPPEEDL